jgi:hypothetical protein
MGFRSHPQLTVPTLLLHLLLNLTSFVFSIPHRRIKEGSRIWPEYRLHSLVFASRSLAAMLLYWYERTSTPMEPYYWGSVIIVLLTLAAADLSTASVQQYASKSIRELDISRATRYFFTVCQFYATSGVLFGVRRYTLQFLNVLVVQVNPFLFTLRRKNLISHAAAVTIYGILLIFGFTVCVYEYTSTGGVVLMRTVAFIGNLAIVWRTSSLFWLFPPVWRRLAQNKYLIWAALGVLAQFMRPYALMRDVSLSRQLMYTCSMMAVLLNGYIKCRARNYEDDGNAMQDKTKVLNGAVKTGQASIATPKKAE